MDDLVEQLAKEFRDRGYTWKIGGVQRVPTEDDIKTTLDTAKEKLYTRGVPSQLEIGRLIVHHYRQGYFDVYLQIGSYND